MESSTAVDFLNKELFEKALKSYKHDDTIEIVKFEVSEAFVGEHYGSKMYRSKIDFKSRKFEAESLSVVIKTTLPEDFVDEMLRKYFENEIEMYKNVLPAFNELYERNGQKIEFAPELIYAADQPSMIIILKDLTPDGYKCFRDPPENLEDSKLLIQRLAQFHAASIFLSENNQIDFTSFNFTFYVNEQVLDMFFRDSIKTFKEVVETWGGEFEEYLPKLDNLIKNVGEIGKKCYEPNKRGHGLNVLNHGDFHLRNILVKTNSENRIERFNFADYQLCVWTSPAIDLCYIMGICKFKSEEYQNLQNELVIFYHQELVKALKLIGYMKAPPTLLDINLEFLKRGAMNMALTITYFPFRFIDWSTANLDELRGEQGRDRKKQLYDLPALKEIIQKEMKSWKYKGWW